MKKLQRLGRKTVDSSESKWVAPTVKWDEDIVCTSRETLEKFIRELVGLTNRLNTIEQRFIREKIWTMFC